MTFSVIIPAYNAARTLPQTLASLATADPAPLEVIVVDDGSTDDTARIARTYGVRVIRLERNLGAATAKNRGAAAAAGEILFFTDADVVVPPRTFALLDEIFQQSTCEGVVGLLDENTPHANWASQFKNLWMHFTYARFGGAPRIGLFYTSVAAMRRAVFSKTGGFDENYRGASIAEDTEFGQRAWGQGVHIVLEPRLRVVHLKAYTLVGILCQDFRRARALTLMRLRKRGQPFFTSVPLFYQLAVPTLYLALLCAAFALITRSPLAWPTFGLTLVLFYALNASFLWFLLSKRGSSFALASALFLPLDVFVVGLGMMRALVDALRGIRY